jgi:FtsP/CotA-like multicopper oxidase with cupredoxin domain
LQARRTFRRTSLTRALPAVLALTLVVGCGSDGDDDAGTAPATDAASTPFTPMPEETTVETTPSPAVEGTPAEAPSEEPADDIEVVDITISGGKVTPPPGRVEVDRGTTVQLTVTSDTDDSLHVHGFDIEGDLPAGEPATFTFEADEDGLFEIETHGSHLLLTQLVVR